MPTDDPTEPVTDSPTGTATRRRVSGAQLMDAIEALPGRIASAVGGDGDDGDRDTGDLPPEVTFEPEPEPTPEEIEQDTPPPVPTPSATGTPARRGGFPRRRR